MIEKSSVLRLIKYNIENYTYHQYFISGGSLPRYVYTIGLHETLGYELIAAGLGYYQDEDIGLILDSAVKFLQSSHSDLSSSFEFGGARFIFRPVDEGWSRLLLLGALDYYDISGVKAYQLIPDRGCATVDVPDLAVPPQTVIDGPWQWINKLWPFEVPEDSRVITNVKALQGEVVTECMRWEIDEWELFAGAAPDIDSDALRTISLGAMLGIDRSLEAVVALSVKTGLWRKSAEDGWHEWNSRGL